MTISRVSLPIRSIQTRYNLFSTLSAWIAYAPYIPFISEPRTLHIRGSKTHYNPLSTYIQTQPEPRPVYVPWWAWVPGWVWWLWGAWRVPWKGRRGSFLPAWWADRQSVPYSEKTAGARYMYRYRCDIYTSEPHNRKVWPYCVVGAMLLLKEAHKNQMDTDKIVFFFMLLVWSGPWNI